jgi:uncharacterized protein
MAKHKAICWVITILVFVGAFNWGLVGLSGFIGVNLNIVNLIFGSMPQLEWVVYLLVGAAALVFGVIHLQCKECPCTKK